MKNSVFCLVAVLLLMSCSGGKQQLVEHSPVASAVPLTATKVSTPPVLLYPAGVFLLDDRLVVYNEMVDTIFQSFALDDLSYQTQFGIKGQGPDDFVLPASQPVSMDGNRFTVCDLTMLKQVTVGAEGFEVQATPLPYDFPAYNGLVQLSDSLFCCLADLADEQELMLLGPGGSVKKFSDFPEPVEPRFKDALARNQAYAGLTVAKPDGSRVALFYQFADRWRIFDNQGNMLSDNVMAGEAKSLPEVKDEERRIHAIKLYATDKYIYALNLDMGMAEIAQKQQNPNVRVYDWDGNPVKQYRLDGFISAFAVDEAAGYLYGVFAEDMDHIYKYRLE